MPITELTLYEGEPTYERMSKIARLCSQIASSHFNETLDFSRASIEALDRVILSGWADVPANEVPEETKLSFGAYLGEVLVRSTRGRWVSEVSDTQPASIMFLDSNDEMIKVCPFKLIDEKLSRIESFDLNIAFEGLIDRLQKLGVV